MIGKIVMLFLVMLLAVPVNAQELFELELQESGSHYFGHGFIEGQILSTLNKTQFKVIPQTYSYSDQPLPKVRVNVSINNQDASTSTSSSFRYTSSSSQRTRIYGYVTITATFVGRDWADSVTTSVADEVSFTEYSDLSVYTSCYSFNLPTAISREQKQIELNNKLLSVALTDLRSKISALNPPLAPAQQVVDLSGDNLSLRQAKVRLSPQAAQKYSQLGYISVKRGNNIIQYRIIGIEGNVVIVEFSGAPPQKGDVLY